MSNPSSPSPSPPSSPPKPLLLLPPPVAEATTTAAAKPVPWTHEETVHLIQTYQHTWYSLNRTHLRSLHWDSVSSTVASLCSYPPTHPTLKSPSQCRHKLEKLRKRYRTERQRILDGTLRSSSWPYYDLMERLERGPLPITAIPIKTKNSRENSDEDSSEEETEDRMGNRRVRSVDYILRRAGVVNRFAVGGRAGVRVPEEEKREDEGRKRTRREEVTRGLAAEVRGLAERYVEVEEVKMEMARETEKWKMDMERKRLELILESERKVVDAIARAFAS